MSEDIGQVDTPQKPPEILNYLDGLGPDMRFDMEVSIKQSGRVIVFHSHAFTESVAFIEYDLSTCKMAFMMEDGARLDVGIALNESVAAHMHNAHQILMVLLDPETGEAKRGAYVPVILLRTA